MVCYLQLVSYVTSYILVDKIFRAEVEKKERSSPRKISRIEMGNNEKLINPLDRERLHRTSLWI